MTASDATSASQEDRSVRVLRDLPSEIGMGTIAHHGASLAGRGWLLFVVAVANIAVFAVYLGIILVLLPKQIDLIASSSKVLSLGLAGGIGAIAAVVCTPLFGGLSDRTRLKVGKRSPWLVGGAVIAFAAMYALSKAQSVAGVIVWWFVIQAALSAYLAALIAVVPDRVEPSSRGLFSAAVGMGPAAGGLVGTFVAAYFQGNLTSAYAVLGAGPVVAALLLAFTTRDKIAEVWTSGVVQTALVGPARYFRNLDFVWLFVGRVCIMLAIFLVQNFYFFILQDEIAAPPGMSPADGVAYLTLVNAIAMIVATGFAGWLSDRLGKRKVFVFVAASVFVLAATVPFLLANWWSLVAFAVISGFGIGAYWSVDTAMVTLVLPSQDRHAQDMAVMGIANAAPQVVAPFVGGLAIALFGYPSLFVLAAVLCFACAVSVLPVKAVP